MSDTSVNFSVLLNGHCANLAAICDTLDRHCVAAQTFGMDRLADDIIRSIESIELSADHLRNAYRTELYREFDQGIGEAFRTIASVVSRPQEATQEPL